MLPITLAIPPELIVAKTTAIYGTMLRQSRQVREGNFTAIETEDLSRLFRLYDQHFFDGWLSDTVRVKAGRPPLTFRLSTTMTRAGGKTITRLTRTKKRHFEIAVASRLLFMSFEDVQRPVTVCGLLCTDRLQALQRIMEHEILHLTEMLAWGKSSCSAPRFRGLAAKIFGHTTTKHELVTPVEKAVSDHGIKLRSQVEFEFRGVRMVGFVNRIHQRATVLVEDADGQLYTSGKRFKKFLVPLPLLRVVGQPSV